MRIYELAIQAGVKHYVWGGLDYGLRDGNYNPKYRCVKYAVGAPDPYSLIGAGIMMEREE